jgi:hypothetical protein
MRMATRTFFASVKPLAILQLFDMDLKFAQGLQCFQDPYTRPFYTPTEIPRLHTLVLIFITFPKAMPIAFYRGTRNVRHLTLETSGPSIISDVGNHSLQIMPDDR